MALTWAFAPTLASFFDRPAQMQSISEWLQALGLDEYVKLFEQNKIDIDILPDLTERDLQDLGLPLGDRKRLLKALAASAAPQIPEQSVTAATSPRSLIPTPLADC